MHRAKRIAVRGWRRALNIATFGYYPFHDVAVGKACIGDIIMTIPGATFSMSVPSAAFTMTIPGATIAMSIPAATLAMTAPSATIDIEDCE
jgi:hypothetical protein